MILVTRHVALKEFLEGDCGVKISAVIEHATAEAVAGKEVIGVLPIHLAAICGTYTALTLNIPAEMRGKELTLEDLREFAGPLVTYKVTVI